MPYGQEGRQAVVYQLVAEGGERKALKVFKARYRLPELASLADQIAPFAGLSGLQVCQRTVLVPQRHAALLRQHPDLTYAVLMPWVEGPTWMEVLLEKRELSPEDSLALTRSLAGILATMEQRRLAHCDLSGPNVMLPALLPSPAGGRGVGGEGVALVDLEQLYGPGLVRPELLPGGSPGYAHKIAPQGLWGATADRFAGAVLLAEMLGWCDEKVREAAWGENYFDPQEMQRESERYQTLVTVLQERWGGEVVGLFERAWRSETLADCPTFGEWLVRLPESVPELPVPPPVSPVAPDAMRVLIELARQFEEQGKLDSALETYRQAQVLVPAGSGMAEELALIMRDLKARQEAAGADLACLFEEGIAAYKRGEWTRAKELFAEVVRRQPDYARDGQQAAALLATTEKQLTSLRRRMTGWIWGLGLIAVLLLGLGIGTGVELVRSGQQGHGLLATDTTAPLTPITAGNADQVKPLRTLKVNLVNSVTFDSEGKVLASGSSDGAVCLWRVADDALLRTLEGPTGQVESVAFSPDGETLASGAYDSAVRLWRVSDGVLLRTLKGHTGVVSVVAFSPDGETLASGSYDNTVRLWRVSDGKLLHALEGPRIVGYSVAFSPDGTIVASPGGVMDSRGSVQLWRVSDGSPLLRTREHGGWVTSVAFSPDGAMLASGSYDNTVRLWRASDGELLRTLEGHTGYVHSVAFSPDGSILASASGDHTVRLWRVADGTLLRTLEGHTSRVRSVAFSPDGTMLASAGSYDNTVCLWGVR